MKSYFLKVFEITSHSVALKSSLNASLQRNMTYKNNISKTFRVELKEYWKDLLINEAENYFVFKTPEYHNDAILRISNKMTFKYSHILHNNRFRIGTAQKSLNLYLKCLWCLGEIPEPPHCPVDRIVLQAVKCNDSWTKNDSIEKYIQWIKKISDSARKEKISIAEWECQIWNRYASLKRKNVRR